MDNRKFFSYTAYLESEKGRLFTAVYLPYANGKFPVIIYRNPYVDDTIALTEEEACRASLGKRTRWLEAGYAVVVQHCRGCGKSEGACIPYIHEHEDSNQLYDWIRKQDFYNGELYLIGSSYLASTHYTAAPYADDIKGAVFGVQDCVRYNICYRNGCFKKGLHGDWCMEMYKKKQNLRRNYTIDSFDTLPLLRMTEAVFGEPCEELNEVLRHPEPQDDFWNSLPGGADTRDCLRNVKFPVLLTSSFYDIYTGGVFDIWNSMTEETRSHSAFVVSAYDHGDDVNNSAIRFPKGSRKEMWGDYAVSWINSIRGKEKSPFEKGKITHYCLFEDQWAISEALKPKEYTEVSLGDKIADYTYDPHDPPKFRGGLSRCFGGAKYFEGKPNSRQDIITVYSKPFEKAVRVRGKSTARLVVSSDCEDTCFYVRISIEKKSGDFPLRDDITTLGYAVGSYVPNTKVALDLEFDEHAFMIHDGERLRVDISSADNNHYVRHTNHKGLYCEQETVKIAHNTVYLNESSLKLGIVPC